MLAQVLALAFPLLPLIACNLLSPPTPLPLPTELATPPLPLESQPGGLEATFVSAVTVDGAGEERCFKLYRFYPDSLALYANFTCSAAAPSAAAWPEIDRWFRRDDHRIMRGDYYRLGHRIWIRIVGYDAVHEITYLRQFQGELCDADMVLQEPTVRGYAGVPSPLMQPVLEYMRISPATAPDEAEGSNCRVAGFKILSRPSVTLAGGLVEFSIQTDPGEACELHFTKPDGSLSRAPGTGAITADGQGICHWEWELDAQTGKGLVTIRIDQITQDFALDIR